MKLISIFDLLLIVYIETPAKQEAKFTVNFAKPPKQKSTGIFHVSSDVGIVHVLPSIDVKAFFIT